MSSIMRMIRRCGRIVVFIVLFFEITALTAWAVDDIPKDMSPIQVEADHMMSDQKKNTVFFSGKVEARQDDIVIHADEITVYYLKAEGKEETNSQKATSIDRLQAIGNVEITKEELVATGDQADYFSNGRKLVISGNTKVWQNNNLVTGEKIILFLDEGKSIVERSQKKGERVKFFYYPDSGKK